MDSRTLRVALVLLALGCGREGSGKSGDAGPTSPPRLPSWPGDQTVTVASEPFAFGGNLSGLVYEPATASAPAVLWAVQNEPSTLHRLVWNGAAFADDVGWTGGRTLTYPDGSGSPDGEGLTRTVWKSSEIYVAAEADNLAEGSRLSILRYDLGGATSALSATHEWDLTADLPATEPNQGLEGVAWIPDAYLVQNGFVDESRNALYDPTSYAEHAAGIFMVGVEATGVLYGYVLDLASGAFRRVTTVPSGQPGVMDLSFDRDQSVLFSLCDAACGNRISLLAIGADGRFTVLAIVPPPPAFVDMNNEGIALAPDRECVDDHKSFFWADDDESGGFSIRRGTIRCGRLL